MHSVINELQPNSNEHFLFLKKPAKQVIPQGPGKLKMNTYLFPLVQYFRVLPSISFKFLVDSACLKAKTCVSLGTIFL